MKNLIIGIVIVVAVAAVVGVGLYFNRDSGAPPLLSAFTYTDQSDGSGDGLAIVDLNPESDTFGNILQQYPLGPGVNPHHLFFNRDGSQLYSTALGGDVLYKLTLEGDRFKSAAALETGRCQVGEDLFFTGDGSTFYLTCMGSDSVSVFNAKTNELVDEIVASGDESAYIRYPHGIWIANGLDRMIVTETVSPALDDLGSSVTVIAPSTGEVLSTHVLAKADGKASAPVEVFFLPNRPLAYISGMTDASLWTAVWNEDTEQFDFNAVDDGAERGHSWPLEIYLGPDGNLYVSWAQPGVVNVYNIQDPEQPKFMRTLPAAAGAHHIMFSKDKKYMFVQNNLLNLDGMNAGTITVVDVASGDLVATVDSFIEAGLLPTSFVLLNQQ